MRQKCKPRFEKSAPGVWPSSATALFNKQWLSVSPTPLAVSRCCARGRAHSVRNSSRADALLAQSKA